MENNLLDTLSVNVTIISSIVAIAAVSICSILTALITQRGARKSKQTEMIFHEMVTAYYRLIEDCDTFTHIYDSERLVKLTESFSHCLLFASDETTKLLTQYVQMLTAESLERKRSTGSGKMSDEEAMRQLTVSAKMGSCRKSLLSSMQRDLRK